MTAEELLYEIRKIINISYVDFCDAVPWHDENYRSTKYKRLKTGKLWEFDDHTLELIMNKVHK